MARVVPAATWLLGALTVLALISASIFGLAHRFDVPQVTRVNVVPAQFHRVSLMPVGKQARIEHVTVQSGSWVQPGDIVATLDSADISGKIAATRRQITEAMRIRMCLALAQKSLENPQVSNRTRNGSANLNNSAPNSARCVALFGAIDALRARRGQAQTIEKQLLAQSEHIVALRRSAALVPDGQVVLDGDSRMADYVMALRTRGEHYRAIHQSRRVELLHRQSIRLALEDVSVALAEKLNHLIDQLGALRRQADNPVITTQFQGRVAVDLSNYSTTQGPLITLDIPLRGATEFAASEFSGARPPIGTLAEAQSIGEFPQPMGNFRVSRSPVIAGRVDIAGDRYMRLNRVDDSPRVQSVDPPVNGAVSLHWNRGSVIDVVQGYLAQAADRHLPLSQSIAVSQQNAALAQLQPKSRPLSTIFVTPNPSGEVQR